MKTRLTLYALRLLGLVLVAAIITTGFCAGRMSHVYFTVSYTFGTPPAGQQIGMIKGADAAIEQMRVAEEASRAAEFANHPIPQRKPKGR